MKSQRAEENRAYVRGPLWQRQRAFAAALALAEQCALCSVCQCARPDQDDGGNDEISGRSGGAALGRYSNIWMRFAENVTKLSAGTSAKLILSPLLFRRHLPLKVSEALLHLLLPIPAMRDVAHAGGNS